MRFAQLTKDKVEKVFIQVRNDESSADLAAGTLVCFTMDATRDGLDVVGVNTGGAAKSTSLFAGVLPRAIVNARYGISQVYGYVNSVKHIKNTRAASTDSYTSMTSVAVGDFLFVQTLGGGGVSRSGAGAANQNPGFLIAAESVASVAASASTTSDTSIAVTGTMKAFVRAL